MESPVRDKDILGKGKVTEAPGDHENMPLSSPALNPPPTGTEAILPRLPWSGTRYSSNRPLQLENCLAWCDNLPAELQPVALPPGPPFLLSFPGVRLGEGSLLILD